MTSNTISQNWNDPNMFSKLNGRYDPSSWCSCFLPHQSRKQDSFLGAHSQWEINGELSRSWGINGILIKTISQQTISPKSISSRSILSRLGHELWEALLSFNESLPWPVLVLLLSLGFKWGPMWQVLIPHCSDLYWPLLTKHHPQTCQW